MNMKTTLFLFIISISFFCTQCDRQLVHNSNFVLKEPIANIVDSFVISYPNEDIYELYINKIDPHHAILILYAGKKSVTENENAYNSQKSLIHVISNGTIINVYSGIERYVEENNKQKITPFDLGEAGTPSGIYWVILDDFGEVITKKDYDGVYPFMPLPLQSTIDFHIYSIEE